MTHRSLWSRARYLHTSSTPLRGTLGPGPGSSTAFSPALRFIGARLESGGDAPFVGHAPARPMTAFRSLPVPGTLSNWAGFRNSSDVGIAFVSFECKQFAFPLWLWAILRETATLGASFTGRAGAFISAPAILGASFR